MNKRPISGHLRGLLITAAGVLIISPDGLLSRLILTDHWTMTFWRGALLSVGMLLVIAVMYRGQALTQYRSVLGSGGWIKVAAYSAGTVAFVFALTHTSVANTLVILATTPLFAALISRLWLSEPILSRTLVVIALVALGLGVMAQGSNAGGASRIGDAAALASAFFLALGFVLVRRYPAASSLAAISISGLVTALLMLPLAAPLSITAADFGFLVVMGCVVLPLGSSLMFIGPRYLPAAEVGLLLLLETVLGPLWVWLALGEAVGPWSLAGGGIIVGALFFNTLRGLGENRRSRVLI